MSSFISAAASTPCVRTAWRAITASNHPQRRRRPVVAPNSLPRALMGSPAGPTSSVGNGPAPTRVVYAFTIPTTFVIAFHGSPVPGPTPLLPVEDDVTYG